MVAAAVSANRRSNPECRSRHCERSEAIQAAVRFLDCFVADAPRNDDRVAPSLTLPAITQWTVIASEAKQSRLQCGFWIASSPTLLAMMTVLRR
jgi:hypothetical protein